LRVVALPARGGPPVGGLSGDPVLNLEQLRREPRKLDEWPTAWR
jgi:hypothetical protein